MDTNAKKRIRRIRLVECFSTFIICFLIFQAKDFVVALMTPADSYQIRYEEPFGVNNGQKIYSLYRNDDYFMFDADVNEFMLLDADGNTDIKYCVIVHEARDLVYSVILGVMLLIVCNIAHSVIDGVSPFTRKNTWRIRLIGALQFCLAVVPGLVVFLMKFFRFEYSNLGFGMDNIYMFIIGFAIMTIAQVFDYGVKLQEDVDSIA